MARSPPAWRLQWAWHLFWRRSSRSLRFSPRSNRWPRVPSVSTPPRRRSQRPTDAASTPAGPTPPPAGPAPTLGLAALISRALVTPTCSSWRSAAARARGWLAGEGFSRLTRHTRDALRRLAGQHAALSRRAACQPTAFGSPRPATISRGACRQHPHRPRRPPRRDRIFRPPCLPGWLPPANRRGKRTCHAPCHRPPPASPPSRSISPGCRAACPPAPPSESRPCPDHTSVVQPITTRRGRYRGQRSLARRAARRTAGGRWLLSSPPPTSRATRQRRSHRWHAARSQAARRPRRDNHRPISARAGIFQPPARRPARLPRKLTSAPAITRPRRATSRSVAARPRHPPPPPKVSPGAATPRQQTTTSRAARRSPATSRWPQRPCQRPSARAWARQSRGRYSATARP